MPEKLKVVMQTVRHAAAKKKQDDAAVKKNGSFWQRTFQWYSHKLSTHPILTKSLTSAFIAAWGDVLCQAAMYGTTNSSAIIISPSPPPPPPADAALSTTNHDVINDGDKSKEGKNNGMMETSKLFVWSWWYSFWTTGWDANCTAIFALLGFAFVAPTSHYWYEVLARHSWTTGQSVSRITKRVFLDQFVWTPVFFVIWLASFWTLQDIATATTTTATTTTANSATAADTNQNESDATPATETETSAMSNSPEKISSQLAQHLPEVMIAVRFH
jgi:hypothetical protein